jgi:hypothetical protein
MTVALGRRIMAKRLVAGKRLLVAAALASAAALGAIAMVAGRQGGVQGATALLSFPVCRVLPSYMLLSRRRRGVSVRPKTPSVCARSSAAASLFATRRLICENLSCWGSGVLVVRRSTRPCVYLRAITTTPQTFTKSLL